MAFKEDKCVLNTEVNITEVKLVIKIVWKKVKLYYMIQLILETYAWLFKWS